MGDQMGVCTKVKNLCKRFPVCAEEYGVDRREFDSKVAWLRFWDALLPRGKSKAYIEGLSEYVCRELTPITERYARGEWKQPTPIQKLDKIPVWVCWWQGEEAMPPIVKACEERLKNSLPETAELHLITWDNFADYCDIPAHVLEKYHEGIIGPAHLADILRYALLSSYGGAWIDSTVWLTDRIQDKLPEYLEQMYFTQRFPDWSCCPQEACRGKWCNFFFMGRSDCMLFSYVYEALLSWWEHHDRLIDYVAVDYVIWAGYCGVPEIKRLIDAVPANNEQIWSMAKALNDSYEPAKFDSLMSGNDFYKLSYKGRLEEEIDNKTTVYGHILKENR